MLRSESLNELGAALAKAQGAIEGALKDSDNPFFKSRYADLSSVWEACRQHLTANGLSVIQSPTEAESGIGVETMLLHSSGQYVSDKFTMPVTKSDAQGVGSALTYARRYALAAMVGVAPEDDDGNAATKAAPKKVVAIGKGVISATTGAVESLSSPEKDRARSIAKRMGELWKEEDRDGAYNLYFNKELDIEMKTAIWSFLQPYSGMRAELKNMNEQKGVA